MKKVMVAAVCGLSLGLSGCVVSVGGSDEYGTQSDWQDREQKNRRHISRLQQNNTHDETLRRMGVADFNELYVKGEDTFQVLYYRTQRIEGDGVTSKDECTPLVFKNSLLVGWGESAYKLIGQ
ncbi:DUF3192 domain-containing protein [uncultured Paraglaciecola sp.]|uniref:DUF3192 domain-containing protein n=1 Tax=uncultured Paraglaciecola sp. TaxID=1765024 RepID=UPI002633246F|nr:DUF3192 domain-containing protein [uncultured Paraglaciecola sp.]